MSEPILDTTASNDLTKPVVNGEPRARPTGIRRGSLEVAAFARDVLDHVVHTCAKEVRDASAFDLYYGFALTVRDRLVHRWLATQRTYFERDVKHAYYLSSEFLTGRSLGLCLLNLGLYEAAETLAAERGFDLGQILDSEGDPGLGNGGLGRSGRLFHGLARHARAPCRGLRHSLRLRHVRATHSKTAGKSSTTTTGWFTATPGSCPRHEDAQTVELGGRIETRHDEAGAPATTGSTREQ